MDCNSVYKQAGDGIKSTRESIYARMRDQPRFSVNFRAEYFLKEEGARKQECRVTNLSASGAAVRFPLAESIKESMPIVLEIAIPNTILRVSAAAEIVWVKQRFNTLVGGLRFENNLSESMLQRLAELK